MPPSVPSSASAGALDARADDDGLPTPRRYLATAAILGAITLVVLDGAIANVALPTIAQTLRVTPAQSVWVVTGYQLAVVMFLLPAAALGESRGYRKVFGAGVLLFTVASALCALSPSLPWLVGARFLQGLGSAAVMPLGLALLRFTYPRRLLGDAIAWNALAVALSSAAGPTVGAAILSVASWPWLFAVNIPLGVLVLLAASGLPRPKPSRRPLDGRSVALNALVFGAFVLGIDQVTTRHALGAGLLLVALIGGVALVRREMPQPAPLIPLDLLRRRSFRISVIASVCCFTGQMASYVALPFYIQHGLGQSAFATGLLMTPWPLAVMLAAPVSGRLSGRVSTGWLCAGGGVVLGIGLALCALWPLQGSHLLPLVLFTIVCGLGFGFFQTPNNRNMLLSAPKERSGAAGGMQGAARLTGQTAGSVLMTLLFTVLPVAVAPRWGLGLAAVLALAGGLVSTLRGNSVDVHAH
jgi:DHA2 family multidrug resistance protein-like MFS transporter